MQPDNKYKIGDWVTIVKIPPDIGNETEMNTKRVFEICIGKTYPIQGFDKYGHLELDVSKDVDHVVGGFMNTIWIEAKFVIPGESA